MLLACTAARPPVMPLACASATPGRVASSDDGGLAISRQCSAKVSPPPLHRMGGQVRGHTVELC